MKKQMKNILVALMIIMTISSPIMAEGTTATLDGTINIRINDNNIIFIGQKGERILPLIYNGSTYLPVRSTSETLGLDVGWDQKTKTIDLTTTTREIEVYEYNKPGGKYTAQIIVSPEITIRIDGRPLSLTDVSGKQIYPIIIDGTTYLPLRTIADTLGVDVIWDNTNRVVGLISTKNIIKKQLPNKPVEPTVIKPKTDKQTYIKIQEAIRKGESEIKFKNLTKTQMAEISNINNIDNFLQKHEPYVGYISRYQTYTLGNDITLTLNYKIPGVQVKSEISQTEAYVNKFIKENILSSDTDLEKLHKIHRYIVENTVYLNDDNLEVYYAHVPYGIISKGKVVCSGYAKMTQLMLDKVGIENLIVVGSGNNSNGVESHAWNIVKINGSWYHVDATWNDTTVSLQSSGFDIPNNDLKAVLSYNYYNKYLLVSDDQIGKDHTWNRNEYPKANQTMAPDETYPIQKQKQILDKYLNIKTGKDLENLVRTKTSKGEIKFTFVLTDRVEFSNNEISNHISAGIKGNRLTSYSYSISKLNITNTITIYNLTLN